MSFGLELPFDELRRRRIYLMRHGEADYFDPSTGRRRPDPRVVPLTAQGQEEAGNMSSLLKDATFDRAICSGLPRTKQTAEIVLGGRDLELEVIETLEEIRGGTLEQRESMEKADYAYTMFEAHKPGAAWALGEKFTDFEARIVPAFNKILQEPGWGTLLLVLHGAVNRAILNSLLGTGLKGYGFFEQDSCCLNIIDLDMDPGTMKAERVVFRAINVVAQGHARADKPYVSIERLALGQTDGAK